MERNNALKKALKLIAANELFEASKFYCEQFNTFMSEAAFYKSLERMVKANYLIKISKGLYARPEQTKYGLVPPSEEDIVASLIDNSRSFQTEESIRDIFLSQEELPDILVCLSAVHTRCAYQAAVDYNKVGTVQILGYYDSEAILDAVSKNILYSTITLDTVQMGRSCVQALEEYVKTGYTNGYRAVDTHLITAPDANRLLSGRTP